MRINVEVVSGQIKLSVLQAVCLRQAGLGLGNGEVVRATLIAYYFKRAKSISKFSNPRKIPTADMLQTYKKLIVKSFLQRNERLYLVSLRRR